jgi:hypothetical protein
MWELAATMPPQCKAVMWELAATMVPPQPAAHPDRAPAATVAKAVLLLLLALLVVLSLAPV